MALVLSSVVPSLYMSAMLFISKVHTIHFIRFFDLDFTCSLGLIRVDLFELD